ncbi:MAG: hypothetical protein QM681_24570 [Novosphingobium sp.]
MTTFLLMLAAGAVAPAPADVPQSRKCEYNVERVANRSGAASYHPGQDAAMHLRAVETRIDGCPVLREAGSGRLIEPPMFASGPAKVAPAR